VAHVQEITVWTRGVVKDKEGRDVANGIAKAADKEGKFTQAFDNYVDLPDRVNVPVRKYARISDDDIEMKYEYENEKPQVVVVVDATLVKGIDVLRGVEKDGVLVVNTTRMESPASRRWTSPGPKAAWMRSAWAPGSPRRCWEQWPSPPAW